MSTNTSIEWCDATWNPIAGCTRVSEGCRNCYAERMAHRFAGPGQPYAGLTVLANGHPQWSGRVSFFEKRLLDPLKWKKPRRIFVNSMSDLFHPNVQDEWIDRIFAVMALCPQHTFQVLTKRPKRMVAYLADGAVRRRIAREANAMMRSDRRAADSDALASVFLWSRSAHAVPGEWVNYLSGISDREWPLPNVQLGVSVEDQKTVDERIPLLLQTPAALRFVSVEPQLGAVDLSRYLSFQHEDEYEEVGQKITNPDQALARTMNRAFGGIPLHDSWVRPLDWVICGGESGPGARPMHPEWVRGLRDQCVNAGVPFFFKQWGEFTSEQCPGVEVRLDSLQPGQCVTSGVKGHHTLFTRVGKKAAGALLDGREWKEFPQ